MILNLLNVGGLAVQPTRGGRLQNGLSGSEAALAPAEGATPIEASGAPGHVRVVSAWAVPAIGWATIIVATLIHSPAPVLVAGTSRVPTSLKDANDTA